MSVTWAALLLCFLVICSGYETIGPEEIPDGAPGSTPGAHGRRHANERIYMSFPKVLRFNSVNYIHVRRQEGSLQLGEPPYDNGEEKVDVPANLPVTGASTLLPGFLEIMYVGKSGRNEYLPRINFNVTKYAKIEVNIPDVMKPQYVRLHVSIRLDEVSEEYFVKDVLVPVEDVQTMTFIQTNKPIYKPGDVVKMRVVNVRLDTLSVEDRNAPMYTKFELQKPAKNRIAAQWHNLTWEEGFKGVQYKIPKDGRVVEFGTYKIVLTPISGRSVQSSITVKKYVLPRFLVSVKAPKYVLLNQDSINVTVCANYTFGKPVIGRARVSACLKQWYYRKQIEPCRKISTTLEHKGCREVVFEDLQYKNDRSFSLRNRVRSVVFTATVFEADTGKFVKSKPVTASVSRNPFQLKFKSKDLFHLGLPYVGRIQATYHNGLPYPFPKVRLSVSQNWWWYGSRHGYEELITGDKHGLVRFTVPNLPNEPSVTLRVQSVGYAEKRNKTDYRRQLMVETNAYLTLKKRFSTSGGVLSLKVLDVNVSSDGSMCPESVHLLLTSTAPLWDKAIHLQTVSRGQLESWRLVQPLPSMPPYTSQDGIYGHYTTVTNKDGRITARCLPGWIGANCLTPLCSGGCGKGYCVGPNTCKCPTNLSGKSCNVCTKRTGCKHGRCIDDRFCVCYFGFTGYNCNYPQNSFLYTINSETLPEEWTPEPDNMTFYTTTEMPISTQMPEKLEEKGLQEITINFRHIKVPLSREVGNGARLAVFFSYEEEIIAEMVELKVKTCLPNEKVAVDFEMDKVTPGRKIKLVLTSEGRETNCALSISDAGLQAFALDGKLDPTRQNLLDEISKLQNQLYTRNTIFYNDRIHCLERETMAKAAKNDFISRPSYQVDFFDSSYALNKAGLLFASNQKLRTATCSQQRGYRPYYFKLNAVGGARVADSAPVRNPPIIRIKKRLEVKIRKFFPESWIFNTYTFLAPKKIMTVTVPDSITTWNAALMCMSTRGLGIAPPTSLTVFKPFFVSVSLPYSAIRGELIRLPVSVHNYDKACYQVELELVTAVSKGKVMVVGNTRHELCMCNKYKQTALFNLRLMTVGKLAVQFRGIARQPSAKCGKPTPDTKGFLGVVDAVERKILVEPEGVPEFATESTLLCSNGRIVSTNMAVKKPLLYVPQSLNHYLSWTADILGPSVTNLQKLVRLPYGCGEQNLATMVPSIYVLNYLQASRLVAPKLREKALKYIQDGYTRQLRYRHVDGSFSAFGKSDKRGSTWLTAFVARSFFEAKKHYKGIDDKVIEGAVKFLLSRQVKQKGIDYGCFRETGRVLSTYMQGGLGRASNLAMTAYVIPALIYQMNKDRTDNITRAALQRSVTCLVKGRFLEQSNYIVAMAAYALKKINSLHLLFRSAKREIRRRLQRTGRSVFLPENKSGRVAPVSTTTWWRPRYSSADVETTAYAALALNSRRNKSRSETLPLVLFLTSQRNSLGGWRSTQDTVVSLRALTEFGEVLKLSNTGSTKLLFKINTYADKTSTGETKSVVKEIDRFVERRKEIKSTDTNVRVAVIGKGCAVVMLNSVFNIPRPIRPSSKFFLEIDVSVNKKKCDERSVGLKMRYLGNEKESGMALMTVRAPTGWYVDVSEPARLLKMYSSKGLKRVERNGRSLALYMDSVEKSDNFIINVRLLRRFVVEGLKPSVITLTDYYRPEYTVEKFMNLGKC